MGSRGQKVKIAKKLVKKTVSAPVEAPEKRDFSGQVWPKKWFIYEKFNTQQAMVIWNADEIVVVGETEKAVKLYVDSDYGHFQFWAPKSAVETEKEVARWEAEMDKKMQKGLEYNKSLVVFAKNNGIKGVREGLRTATLVKKIKAAGLEVPVRK